MNSIISRVRLSKWEPASEIFRISSLGKLFKVSSVNENANNTHSSSCQEDLAYCLTYPKLTFNKF